MRDVLRMSVVHQDDSRGRYNHCDDAAIYCTMVLGIFHSHGMYWDSILCMRGICLQYKWERSAPDHGRAHTYIARSASNTRMVDIPSSIALAEAEDADALAAKGRSNQFSHFVTMKKRLILDLQGKDPKCGL
jgi:hypothetical protein